MTALKGQLLASGLTVSQLVSTAWAAAASFRGTDLRGGANGARIRLEPQRNWEVNDPPELAKVLAVLEQLQQDFDGSQSGRTRVSLADLIVLGGGAAIEQAARDAGHDISVPFAPGRTDTTQELTHVVSFAVLEPKADGFRNYLQAGQKRSPQALLVDRAAMLTLTVPEMTVLIGGMRALNANYRQAPHGVLTTRPGQLTNDFFVNLLHMRTEWPHPPTPRTSTRDGTAPPATSRGPPPPSTSCSGPTPSFAPPPRSTRAPTPRISSSATSWPHGTRS